MVNFLLHFHQMHMKIIGLPTNTELIVIMMIRQREKFTVLIADFIQFFQETDNRYISNW